MAAKSVNILLRLQDSFSKPMKNVTASTKEQLKQMTLASNQVKKWGSGMKSAVNGIAGSAAKAALAFTGITSVLSVASIKQFSSACIELAQVQIESETRLENALRNVDAIAAGGSSAVKAATDDLKDFASQLQNVGVIGDEVTLAGMSQLATFGMDTASIKAISGAMDDLVAKQYGYDATTDNAESIATALGKAMQGTYTSLQKMGVVISDNDKKMLDSLSGYRKAAVLSALIEDHVGGTNAALADTDQGRIQQFSNAWGDAQEEVGKKLLTVKAQLASIGMEVLPDVQAALVDIASGAAAKAQEAVAWLKENRAQIRGFIAQARHGVTAAASAIGKAFAFVRKHLDAVKAVGAVFLGLWAGFKAAAAVQAVVGIASAIGTVVSGLSAAIAGGTGLAGVIAVLGGPATLIIAGVAAAVALIVTHLDECKAAIQWIIDKAQALADALAPLGFGQGGNDGSTVGGYANLGGKALGTPYFAGGLTRVNERGGEIMDLPGGTRIIPHDVSEKMAAGNNVSLSINIQGNVIGNQEYAEELGSYICTKVVQAMGVV